MPSLVDHSKTRRPIARSMRRNLNQPRNNSIVETAIAKYTADDIDGVVDIAAYRNSGTGGAVFDFDQKIGATNALDRHPSGAAKFFGNTNQHIQALGFNATGDFDILIRFSRDKLVPGVLSFGLFFKWTQSGNGRGWKVMVDSDDKLTFNFSTDGTNATEVLSVSTLVLPDVLGSPIWGRIKRVSTTVEFHTSFAARDVDPRTIPWKKLGNTIPGKVGDPFASGAAAVVGGENTGVNDVHQGTIERALFYTGASDAGGVLRTSFDAKDHVSGLSHVSKLTGETWTQQGGTIQIQNTGRDLITCDGSGGLRTAAIQKIDSDAITVYMLNGFTSVAPDPITQVLMDARSPSTNRFYLSAEGSFASRFFTFSFDGMDLAEPHDTDMHLWTVEHKNTGADVLTVSGVGTRGANIFNNVIDGFDMGTLFGDRTDSRHPKTRMGPVMIFDKTHSAAEKAEVELWFRDRYVFV